MLVLYDEAKKNEKTVEVVFRINVEELPSVFQIKEA